MKFIVQKQGKGWPYHVVLSDSAAKKLLKNGNKRAVATEKTTGETFHCSVNTNKNIGYYIYVNATLGKTLGIKEGSSINLSFEIDTTAYQFEMPDEMQEVLNQDAEAYEAFAKLTAGKQRSLIYLVTKLKSIDKRIEKAIHITNKLKLGVTDLKVILGK
jgi:hypothetical protein